MLGRRHAREDHLESRAAALSLLEHVARRAREGLEIDRAVLARAAEARQSKRHAARPIPA